MELAIQMVAEFEREEEARAIAAAEAQARRDEAERVAREEEERRLEAARIESINRRFRELTAELEGLHDIQKVFISQRYEVETLRMKNQQQDTLARFFQRHPQEIQDLEMETAKRLSEAEYKFEEQYKARLAEEHRIEDKYAVDLQAFWEGKPEGDYMIREARDELRDTHRKEYKLWDAHRREQIAAIGEVGKRKMEALVIKQRAEINEAQGRSRIDEVEFKAKIAAEERWVSEVGWQRIAGLQAAEQADYARRAA